MEKDLDMEKAQAKDLDTQKASGGGAAVGWVRAGRGWKPAVKVRLALPCLTYSLLSVH